jgi:hypothetical protein
MRSEPKCPKCGGLDGYEQIKNVVRGAGWYVRGQDMRVLFCNPKLKFVFTLRARG